jgi:type I restriction enzyme S subunit
LTVKDMRGRRPSQAQECITEIAVKESATNIIPPDTVITATRVGLGKVIRVPFAAAINQDLKALVVGPDLDKSYLEYWLVSIASFLESIGSGTTVKGIRLETLRQLPLPLAPLEEQREIVAEIEKQFSRLDEAVANLQRVKANLKRYKASVLKAAVEGSLVETEASIAQREGRNYETGEQLLQRILEERRAKWAGRGKFKEPSLPDANDFYVLPEGWVWASGDQLTSVITDGEHITPRRTPDGVLLLSARNVLNGRLALEDVDYVPEEEYERIARRIEIQAGDVLLSCSGTVGRSCVVPSGLRFTLVRSVAVLRPVIVLAELMAYILQSPLGQSQIDDRKTQTAQANLFQGKIRQLVFALPPMAEQVRIVAEVDRHLS